jgi:hypothetical protein
MLASWEHAIERLVERVEDQHRDLVLQRISAIMEPHAALAPPEALGHYAWYLDVYGDANQVVARIICRGITLRTVYGPLMPGGIPGPPTGATRYKFDRKARTFNKA